MTSARPICRCVTCRHPPRTGSVLTQPDAIFSRASYSARASRCRSASSWWRCLPSSAHCSARSRVITAAGSIALFRVTSSMSFSRFPDLLLAIAMVAFLGAGLNKLILALCIIGWVGYARLIRGQVLKVREYDFVQAARALGASDARILLIHILPNAIQPLIVQASLGMAGAVLSEAALVVSRTWRATTRAVVGRHD